MTPDTSALIQLYFYQPIMYLDTNTPSCPNSKEKFGYWVGVAENVGDELTYVILTPEYQLVSRSSLHPAYHPEQYNTTAGAGDPSSGV